MKLGELAKDDEGDVKTLAFSQARYSTPTNADGCTLYLGLGWRNRPNDVSMKGLMLSGITEWPATATPIAGLV